MGHDSGVSFKPSEGDIDRRLTLPCQKCIACLERRRNDHAIRVMHTLETDPGHRGVTATLTYDPEHLPASGLVEIEHMQLFMKRLRKHTGKGVSYLIAGELGEKTGRPHYHACIVGYEPTIEENPERGYKMDPVLQEKWPYGHVYVDHLTMASAMYSAKYVTKGALAVPHPGDDPEDLPVARKAGEFLLTSQKPALGRLFIERYWRDIYGSGFDAVVMPDGRKYPPPRYYDKWMKENQADTWQKIRAQRLGDAPKLKDKEPNYNRERAIETTRHRNAKLFANTKL